MSKLTFNSLRVANVARLPLFKGRLGQTAHPSDKWIGGVPGSDWSHAQWLQAVLGELGELANVMKKRDRGDLSAEEFRTMSGQEIADVQIYLDILAYQLGHDLGTCVVDKFNAVSGLVASNVFIIPQSGEVYVEGVLASGLGEL